MDADFAPYAPTRAVVETITRFRDRGLPAPLTPKALETIGIAATMAPRTLQALRFLGLLDDDDNPTELFQRLKRASTDEYQGQLAEVVRSAYLRVFSIVNPVEDTDTAVADAFRAFEPSKQRGKMISLFRGVCAEAGIIEPARQRSTTRRARANSTPPKPKQQDGGGTAPKPPAAGSGTANGNVVLTQEAMRSMYFQLLLKKAEAGEADDKLLGRIERLVGVTEGEADKEED